MREYQHVLAAVDLGSDREFVARQAADVSRRYRARLTLVHVVEFLPIDLGGEIVLPSQYDIEDQLVKRADQVLAGLVQLLGLSGIESRVLRGSTKATIVDYAKSHGVDLIVIGRHGRHGLSRLLGSTANAVLHAASCDVLAVNVGQQ